MTVKDAGRAKVLQVVMRGRSGATIDLTDYTAYIQIYESIFEKTMSAKIGLIEGLNIKRHFSINGDELVTIKFQTIGFEDESTYEVTLQSYKLSGPDYVSDNDHAYAIYLESPIVYRNKNKRVSVPFDDRGDVIVKKVFDRYLNDGSTKSQLFFGPAVFNNIKFITPMWRPLQTIDYVTKRCLNAPPNSDPTYIFFQTVDGYFFTNMAQLSSQSPFATYTYHLTSTSTNSKSSFDSFFKIHGLNFGNMFDRLAQTEMGVFNGTLLSHDITKKTASPGSVYNYSTQFERQTHVEKHKIIADSNEDFTGHALQRRTYVPKSSFRHDNMSDTDLYEGWMLQRQSMMNQYYSNSVTIDVPGNTLLRAGQVLNLDIPAPEPSADGKDWKDPYLSGKYIVAYLTHTITTLGGNSEYMSSMELIRDSLPLALPDTKEME